MKVDTIDCFRACPDQAKIPLDRTGEWRKIKDRLVREKKVAWFVGFSTHAEMPSAGGVSGECGQGRLG